MRNALLLVLACLQTALCLGAEPYPAKPVRVIVPLAPGGFLDLTARVISQQLSEQFGKSFVVDNRTGASGNIAYGLVARSAPDGYTLLPITTSTTIVPALFKSLPFDVNKDFAPISEIMGTPMALVVHPSLNVATLKDFIARAQAAPGKFNYGSGGVSDAPHLFTELFKIAAKVNIVHIPYKGGGGESMAALIGGQIQILINTLPGVLPFVRNGKLRALAVTTDGKRSPALPDVPSMNEAGVPGMTIYFWIGLVGPAGMPKEIVNKLHAAVVKAVALPALRDRFLPQGAELMGSSPQEFSALIRAELQRWDDVIKTSGITQE